MTQEDKDLLLKDLSARVPYRVKFVIDNGLNNVRTLIGIGEDIPYEDWQMCAYARGISAIPIEEIKPYLFPLSSMTEEQQHEFDKTYSNDLKRMLKITQIGETNFGLFMHIDWLNKNHFDYRGLIKKGLAIDATGLNIY